MVSHPPATSLTLATLPSHPHSPPSHTPTARDHAAITAGGIPHSGFELPPYDADLEGNAVASSSTLPHSEKHHPPSVMVLFREDYVRTRVYVKELDYRVAVRYALRRHMYKWYVFGVILITISTLLSSKHETIVRFCQPLTAQIRRTAVGFLVPIALLIVVSFPPLFGHEIIGILCGLVWGLGVGFAILAAGTFIGEMATWVAFKWFCTGRAAKFEKKNKLYAALTQLIREKSFMFVLVLRFSAVPGHITTAVSASAGANVWQYMAAAFLTLPKQFTIVYLGKAFGEKSTKNTVISICTTIVTLIGTVIAAVYIYYQMRILMLRTNALTSTTITGNTDFPVTMAGVSVHRRPLSGINTNLGGEPEQDSLHHRRPWLFRANSSFTSGVRTPSRSWSMPGDLDNDNMQDWLSEMKTAQPTAQMRSEDPSVFSFSLIPSPIDKTFLSIRDPSPTASSSGAPARIERRMSLPFPHNKSSDYPPMATPFRDLPGPRLGLFGDRDDLCVSDGYVSRGTLSLDNSRRLGGRDIADDADTYAFARGARRPDYGRMRGESRAALLGRPDPDDDLLGRDIAQLPGIKVIGGSLERSVRKAKEREQVSVGEGSGVKPSSPNSAATSSAKEEDFLNGRPRGESGAALLTRPNMDDNISSVEERD